MDGLVVAGTPAVHYLPIASTLVAGAFSITLWRHWRRAQGLHVMWWAIGITFFGLATLAEAVTTLFGWHEPVFRLWYVSGALLGGAPLAQGTVYLLMKRRTAHRLAAALIMYAAVAAVFTLVAPVGAPSVDPARLDGSAFEWDWVRLFSPVLNIYAVVFLVGGAVLSAFRYRQREASPALVWGNWLIAIGALLPGIGGVFARAGRVEVLYVSEMLGLTLIWAGYTAIVHGRLPARRTA